MRLTKEDRKSIQDVISRQIEAFKRHDRDGAFACTTPAIRRTFGTAENFSRQVRLGHPPVYAPQKVDFGEVVEVQHQPAQQAVLVGPDGAPYLVMYLMEQQQDTSWRINGCVLLDPDRWACLAGPPDAQAA